MTLPAAGALSGAVHRFPIRIYVEDTDYTGMVYHANYLGFAERARTEMLRAIGIEQRALLESGGGFWAVREARLRFHAPARLDDQLIIETRATLIRAAATWLGQRMLRGATLIAEVEILAAYLAADGRPRRQPAEWRARFTALAEAARGAW